MIRFNEVFNDNTLNIFTDASTLVKDNETIGCGGYVAVIGREEVYRDRQILRNSTNNESELYAIYMAIQYALMNRNRVKMINIFSDSQFAIFGLREWIFNWVNNIKNDRLYNSSNKIVSNQKIFMAIIYTILENNLYVNFYHNRGHFTTSKTNRFIELFTKHNFLNDYIDRGIAFNIIKYNNIIDNYTREVFKSEINEQELLIPDYYARSDLNMKKYKKLLDI